MTEAPDDADEGAQGPTEEQRGWLSNVLGFDPAAAAKDAVGAVGGALSDAGQAISSAGSGALASITAPAAAPDPSPGFLEEAEEVVESGVRVVAKTAETVVEAAETAEPAVATVAEETTAAVILGPIAEVAIPVIVAGAILLHEKDQSYTDPETGIEYPSKEAYDEKQDQIKNAASGDNLDRHDQERYAKDLIDDSEKPGGVMPGCDGIIEAIKGLIEALRKRYDDMAELGGGDAGHKTRFKNMQHTLKKLIDMAKAQQCNINLAEAEDWSTYPLP